MTNYQTARNALGARLRELRTETRATGRQLATSLRWPQSKVSKLELGRQTPTRDDLTAWALGVGRPEVEGELHQRLRILESHYASWKRQLAAGNRARQEAHGADEANSAEILSFQTGVVPGLLQTADFARCMFERVADLYGSPRDIEQGVDARMRRQELLFDPAHSFHLVITESALRFRICPPAVMAGQLDRLASAVGLSAYRFGIVPFTAELPMTPFHGFYVFDQKLVKVETAAAGLRIVDSSEIAIYLRLWDRFAELAEYGPKAHQLIAQARAALPSA